MKAIVAIREHRQQIVGIELTRRNLEILLAKLDDPASARTILDGETGFRVTAVENDAHYFDRAPGEMYMPTSGETL
jgi:hypothetical protein